MAARLWWLMRYFGFPAALLDGGLAAWRAANLGYIFQTHNLIPVLTAYENVELMLRMTGIPGKERRARALDCLELVGLTKWVDHRPYELSGGQQQRVAIARALANAPQMIIADEPTGELDSRTATEMLELFYTIVHEQGVTMLMATHDSLSDDIVDKVLRLKDGRILSNEEYLAIEEAERMERLAAEAGVAVTATADLPGDKANGVAASDEPADAASVDADGAAEPVAQTAGSTSTAETNPELGTETNTNCST